MNKTVRFTWILAMIVLVSIACKASAPEEFSDQNGKFSVMTPVSLKETVQAVDTAVGSVDIHLFIGEKGNSAYMVGYSDYPAEIIEQSDPAAMLDGARDGAVSNISGTLISETAITLDGNPGRELVITAKVDDSDADVKARIYMVGNRLYQVLVIGVKGEVTPEDADAFLQSFKLLGE